MAFFNFLVILLKINRKNFQQAVQQAILVLQKANEDLLLDTNEVEDE